jgi:uncharacterized protein (TIGR02246 family)
MAADEQIIQGILEQIETAWNRYDSVSLAAAFAEDANFIQIFGGQLDGRPAIEAAHRHIFATIYRGSHASFVLRSIRFLRPDVAVVFARAHVKFKEGNEATRNRNPPNVDRGKGTGEVANRRVPKYQNLRGASRSPSRSPSYNLMWKLRVSLPDKAEIHSRPRFAGLCAPQARTNLSRGQPTFLYSPALPFLPFSVRKSRCLNAWSAQPTCL